MKKITALLLGIALVVFATDSQAQRIKLEQGNLSFLKGEKEINAEFVYDGMGVGKYAKEEDYIARKTEEYNKKEPGKGDNWARSWKADREARYEPKFHELFAKTSGIASGNAPSAKYTMIVKTLFTEPGYNIGVTRANASVNLEVTIVETENKGNVLAKISVQKAVGRTFGGFDFDTGLRIAEAYADAGKALGAFVAKNAK